MRSVLVVLVLLVSAASNVNAVRSKKFYDTLGVPEDADDRVIKRAYKKQALKWHPDRHADKSESEKKKAEERFKDIAHAYETLSDPEKRQIYDQFGEEGLKQGGPGGPGGHPGGFQFHGDPFEMFNAFFGGGGGGGGGGRQFHFSTGGSGQGFQFQAGGFPGGGFPDGAGFGGGGGGPRMRQQRGPGAAGMYDDDANVLNLDQDSFPGTGKDNPWVYLVEFYAPWCGHCQQLAPKWKQVAGSLKGVVKVAAVNCDQHKSICSQRGVRGYPTIMALSPFSSTWQEYQGDRSASAISSWATSLIGNAAFTVTKAAELKSLLEQCGASSTGSSKRSSAKGGASWSLCLLLVSDKSSAPSLWKALSVAYRGKVAFGFVSSGAQQVLQQLGAAGDLGSEKSRVISICNGDVRAAEIFKGTLKSDPLQRHISSYAAGKKCASQVVLDSSTDLSSLKVAQLKALVQGRNIDCAGCFEKGDYIAAIKGWLASQQGSADESKSEL